VPPTNEEWPPPRWVFVHKHHSLPRESLNDIIASTTARGSDSRYTIGRDEVQRIELETVAGNDDDVAPRGTEILPRKRPNERHFWRRLPFVIGASEGQRTNYIYVVYNFSGGAVHGYQVTEEHLRGIEGISL
jgi:hypothetical protein